MEKTNPPAAKPTTRISTAGNSGFTLLELLIVLFMISLIASITAVSVGRIQERTLFNSEARRLLQTMKQARNTALLERVIVEFRINEDGNAYWLHYGEGNDSAMHALPKDVTVRGEPVIFFPKGNSSGGSVVLTDGKEQEYEIKIDPVQGIAKVGGV